MLRVVTISILVFWSFFALGQSVMDESELELQETFTDIEDALKDPVEVIILDLSSKGLTEIPKSLSRFRNLQILILSDNQISEMPEFISKLRKLQVLYIDSNNIENLYFNTTDDRNFANLEEIYVGFNPIKTVPENLKNIELSYISLGGCKYLDLNEVFRPLSKITTLESVDLSHLNIDTIPSEVANIMGLRSLNLSANPALAWDTSLRFLSQNKRIEELILKNNKFTELPKEVQYFENLKSLDLQENDKLKFNELFDVLAKMKFLSSLNISHCKLDKLPKNIGNLKVLWNLDISYNEINFLPREIGGLTQLETFDLRFNVIQELPDEFAYLLSLEKLYLSNNPLEYIPSGVENMEDMKYVEVPKKGLEKDVKKSLKVWFPYADIVYIKTEEE